MSDETPTAGPMTQAEWQSFQTRRGLRLGCVSAPLIVVGVAIAMVLFTGNLVGGGGFYAGEVIIAALSFGAALCAGLAVLVTLFTPLVFMIRGKSSTPPELSAEAVREQEPFVGLGNLVRLVGCVVLLASVGLYALDRSFTQPRTANEEALDRLAVGKATPEDLELNFDLHELVICASDIREHGGDPSQVLELLCRVDRDHPYTGVEEELRAWSKSEELPAELRPRVEAWLAQ